MVSEARIHQLRKSLVRTRDELKEVRRRMEEVDRFLEEVKQTIGVFRLDEK
jgi:prefoldin subunit 5